MRYFSYIRTLYAILRSVENIFTRQKLLAHTHQFGEFWPFTVNRVNSIAANFYRNCANCCVIKSANLDNSVYTIYTQRDRMRAAFVRAISPLPSPSFVVSFIVRSLTARCSSPKFPTQAYAVGYVYTSERKGTNEARARAVRVERP